MASQGPKSPAKKQLDYSHYGTLVSSRPKQQLKGLDEQQMSVMKTQHTQQLRQHKLSFKLDNARQFEGLIKFTINLQRAINKFTKFFAKLSKGDYISVDIALSKDNPNNTYKSTFYKEDIKRVEKVWETCMKNLNNFYKGKNLRISVPNAPVRQSSLTQPIYIPTVTPLGVWLVSNAENSETKPYRDMVEQELKRRYPEGGRPFLFDMGYYTRQTLTSLFDSLSYDWNLKITSPKENNWQMNLFKLPGLAAVFNQASPFENTFIDDARLSNGTVFPKVNGIKIATQGNIASVDVKGQSISVYNGQQKSIINIVGQNIFHKLTYKASEINRTSETPEQKQEKLSKLHLIIPTEFQSGIFPHRNLKTLVSVSTVPRKGDSSLYLNQQINSGLTMPDAGVFASLFPELQSNQEELIKRLSQLQVVLSGTQLNTPLLILTSLQPWIQEETALFSELSRERSKLHQDQVLQQKQQGQLVFPASVSSLRR